MCSKFKAENESVTMDGVAPPSQRRCALKDLWGIKRKDWQINCCGSQHIRISTNMLTLVGFLCKCTCLWNINDVSYEIGIILITLLDKIFLRVHFKLIITAVGFFRL